MNILCVESEEYAWNDLSLYHLFKTIYAKQIEKDITPRNHTMTLKNGTTIRFTSTKMHINDFHGYNFYKCDFIITHGEVPDELEKLLWYKSKIHPKKMLCL